MAVAALQRVVRLHPLPLAFGQVLAQRKKLLTGVNRPENMPQTSFEACIFRAILSVQLCGTWQSGQVARTPERFVKWIVPLSSSKALAFISWQPVQNRSVLVASSTVLKPPQKKTPARKPPRVKKA